MNAEPGYFEAFYAGAVQHPLMLWMAAALALAFCLKRAGLNASMRRYCVGLALLSFLDAWLTTHHVFGLGPLQGAAVSLVPLFFVLAGDFRYLLLVTSATAEGAIAPTGKSVVSALGLTMIVPVLSQTAVALLPEPFNGMRMLFLIYEVSFVVLTLVLLRRGFGATSLPWMRSVSRFVVVYYSLWAGADLVILISGSDLGYLLRVLPNLLYYGGLIAVIGWFSSTATESRATSA